MPTLKRGQTVTKDDLNVYFYVGGSLSDPFNVTYTLIDSTSGVDEIIGLPRRSPQKFATGSFWAPWTVPDDEPLGLHKIKWFYKETANSEELIDTEEFEIVSECTAMKQEFPDFIKYLIQQLRIKLRDVNPDRDYHFASPSSEETIASFTRTRGYRWPDEQLYGHLIQAANYINLMPPDTSFSLENYPAVWQPILLQQAMVYALWDLAILWIGEEFNYSLNGISLDIDKSSKYQGAADSLQSSLDNSIEKAKARVHIIKGLAQSRFTFGRGAALGPWTGGNNIKRWVATGSGGIIGLSGR